MMKKIFIFFTAFIFLTSNSFAITSPGWLKNIPGSGENPQAISPDVIQNNTALDLMLQNYRDGYVTITLASTSLINIGAGGVMLSNSDGSVRLMVANSSITAVGPTNIDIGVISPSTTYYLYAFASSVTATTFSVLFSASPTNPSGLTYYKRLGSFTTDISGNFFSSTSDVGNGPFIDYSYGSSTSTPVVTTTGLKFAHGTVFVAANTTVTITNLPFTSSSSYDIAISSQFPAQSPAVKVTVISASSFSIQNIDGGSQQGNIGWVTVGK